jgi:hypothetical protein
MNKETYKLPCKDCLSFPICNSIFREVFRYSLLTEEVKYSIFLSRMYQKCSLFKEYLCEGKFGAIKNKNVNTVCKYYGKKRRLDKTDIIAFGIELKV